MPADNDTAASALIRYSGISLNFYKTPIDADTFIRLSIPGAPGPRPLPDLSLPVRDENPPAVSADFDADTLIYDYRNKALRVGTRRLLPVSSVSFNKGRMTSVPDLCNSQLWINLVNTSTRYPATPLAQQMHLKLVGIEVGSRPIVIQDFKEYQSPGLGYFYSFTFPKTEEGLDQLVPK